jgi:hypothetical protein
MSSASFERLRVPVAFVLLLIAAFVFWPRDGGVPTAGGLQPSSSIVVGEPFGEVIPAETSAPAPTLIPTATPAGTPTATPTVAPSPPPVADTFTAEVLVCRSISGSTCNGEINNLPPDVGALTALVRFTDAVVGDTLNAILAGPDGTLAGSPYALQGSGDGYFWAQFQAGALPSGDYVVTATRNGVEVAATAFRKVGR